MMEDSQDILDDSASDTGHPDMSDGEAGEASTVTADVGMNDEQERKIDAKSEVQPKSDESSNANKTESVKSKKKKKLKPTAEFKLRISKITDAEKTQFMRKVTKSANVIAKLWVLTQVKQSVKKAINFTTRK